VAENVKAIEKNFAEDQTFKVKPLPFLLLYIGYGSGQPPNLNHIFVRNRIVKAVEMSYGKEYVTQFDVGPKVTAENLFYGHSEISQLLCANIPTDTLQVEEMKALAYLSLSETQKIDDSIFPNLRLAVLTPKNGFKWIKESEVKQIVPLVKKAEKEFSDSLTVFFKESFRISCRSGAD